MAGSIRILSRKDLAATAASRWRDTKLAFATKRELEISAKLTALGDSPEPDAVDSVLGHSSATALECHICGSSCENVLYLSDGAYGYDESRIHVCSKCFKFALTMIVDAEIGKNAALWDAVEVWTKLQQAKDEVKQLRDALRDVVPYRLADLCREKHGKDFGDLNADDRIMMMSVQREIDEDR